MNGSLKILNFGGPPSDPNQITLPSLSSQIQLLLAQQLAASAAKNGQNPMTTQLQIPKASN